MLSFRQLQLRIRKVPRFVWRLVVLGTLAGGGALAWWYPKSHTFLAVQLGLAVTPPQVIAADVAPSSVVDRVTTLEQKIADLQTAAAQDKTTMASLQADFQQATSEVAASNAELQKQTQEIEATLNKVQSNPASGAASPNPSSASETNSGKVSINTGSLTQLETLPGIGPTYAQRIIDYRTSKGAFKTLEDLQNVNGIGPATYDKLKDQIEL